MSKIDLGDLPIFDDDYFARKNKEAEENQKSTEYWQNLNREKRKKEKEKEATTNEQTSGAEIQENTLSECEISKLYERQGNYNDIMAFYEWFLFSDEVPEELRKEAVFFGGTVPYAVLGVAPTPDTWNPRTFGDVDIYVQLREFKKVRGLITKLKRFTMQDDSADMFIYHKTNNEINVFNDEVYNKLLHKDFGFRGSINVNSKLMDMMLKRNVNVSLYPIFSENGNICSRGFRFGRYYKEKGDYLLDTMLAEHYSLDDFIIPSSILGKDVNIVTPEYIIQSKRNALSKEFKYRKSKDIADINFITEHEDELGVDKEKRYVLEDKIPYIGVQNAYRIKNGKIVDELSGYAYVEEVKYERDSY